MYGMSLLFMVFKWWSGRLGYCPSLLAFIGVIGHLEYGKFLVEIGNPL